MVKRLLLFSMAMMLLFSCGGSPIDTEAETKQENSYLPLVDTTESLVYLPLIGKPWLNSTFGVEVSYLDETVAARAQEMRSAWVRINALHWSAYQPNNNSEFIINPALEQELILADQNGMDAILIIHRTPEWAREYPNSICGPISSDKLDEFANFMKMVVQKYSQPPFNVSYYELWNEPDHYLIPDVSSIPYGCWGDPTAKDYGGGKYAEMLKVVTPAMKSVNPNVKIVLGGLLLDCDPDDLENCKQIAMSGYFEGILKSGGGNYFDVVNFHGYNYYATNTSPIEREYEIPNWTEKGGQVEGKVAFLQEVMAKYGISKPIILSEAGLICWRCEVFPPEYELDKAEYVVWLYVRNWAKGLMATTWYTLDKGGWQGTGLLDAQNNPTLSFYAYKTMTDTLYGANYVKKVTTETDMTVFEFEKGYRIWVLFSMDGQEKSIDLSPYGQAFEAIDLFGIVCDGTSDCHLENNVLSFDLPVFLRFANQD
jgi:hypothetical protein